MTNLDHLPDQFANWRWEFDATKGKNVKIPTDVTGYRVNALDPVNWKSHAQAVAIATTHGLGVSFVVSENDPWFFLDLDDCFENGQWKPEAIAILNQFPGAIYETSASGQGLHIIGACQKGQLQDRRKKWDGWKEFYTTGRICSFGGTGWQPIGVAVNPSVDFTGVILGTVPAQPTLEELKEGVDPAYTGPADDQELITLMGNVRGGAGAAFGSKATIRDLWEANPAVLCDFYPDSTGMPGKFDHSNADAALCAHLAFYTGRDLPRMDRLFRMSGLYRDKWDREDYSTATVENAARLCKKVYDVVKSSSLPKAVDPATMTPEVKETFLTVAEQITHFEGCVYVRDLHKVLMPDGTTCKPEQFKATMGGFVFQMMPDNTKPTTNAFEAFTENKVHRFPQVRSAEFNPNKPAGEIKGNTVNTYFPDDITLTAGDISPFLTLLSKLLPDQRDRQIFLSYAAAIVQNPGNKFQWAPVLQGCEGNGKTFLCDCIAAGVGERYTHRPNSDQLSEKYNNYVEGNLFVVVEEINMSHKIELLETLKPLITNQWMEIRAMNTDKRMARNFTNWVFCTNYQNAVIKKRSDRRYSIFFTAQQHVDDLERDGMSGNYFPDLYDWARNGGFAAVAHYLMNVEIPDEFNPAKGCHRAPATSSTELAITTSAGVFEHEIAEATQDGTKGFRGGWISSWALTKLARDKGFKIGPQKRNDILKEQGYVEICRCSSPIFEEESKRPVLFAKDYVADQDPFTRYCSDQGYASGGMPV